MFAGLKYLRERDGVLVVRRRHPAVLRDYMAATYRCDRMEWVESLSMPARKDGRLTPAARRKYQQIMSELERRYEAGWRRLKLAKGLAVVLREIADTIEANPWGAFVLMKENVAALRELDAAFAALTGESIGSHMGEKVGTGKSSP